MGSYRNLSHEEALKEYEAVTREYEAYKQKGLKLDMSRGKPGKEQLALSTELLSLPGADASVLDGIETRNYGVLDGLPSCKRLFAEILGVRESEVFIGGNASLNLMYDIIAKAYLFGLKDSKIPWSKLEKVKFLCPVPGYDRHFSISQSFGMEMIPVPMNEEGPDMDLVEKLVLDPDVRGIWCVPKYSNPDGIVYSERTAKRLASMNTAAEDFLIMWDNAYCVHEFDGEFVPFPEILSLCREAGHANRVFEFTSTSKITFPGAGVSAFAASEDNLAYMKKLWGVQTISYDKINQLRHVMFLKDKNGVLAQMKKHAAILKPRFEVVLSALSREIGPREIGTWHTPKGGYFVSLHTLPGCARRVHALCKEAGVVLTGAGATWPYGKDPEDSSLRIAPSFPPIDELREAMNVLCICIRLASLEKTLEK